MTPVQNNPQAGTLPSWMTAPTNSVEVRQGDDYSLINVIRNVCLIPMKLVVGNFKLGSGRVSIDTVAKTVRFLEENGLGNDVSVRVNDYSPAHYANKVFSNPKTSLLSKALIGPVAVLVNVSGLEKIFSWDGYDVMSNSVYISSDDPDLPLFQAGMAKVMNEYDSPVVNACFRVIFNVVSPVGGAILEIGMSADAIRNAQTWAEQTQTSAENATSYSTMAGAGYGVQAFVLGYYLGGSTLDAGIIACAIAQIATIAKAANMAVAKKSAVAA